jgi:DNA invertase Pin-like site-specific DNA recombinase
MTRGVKFGRPPKLSAEQIALIARLADEGQTAPQIAETFGVHETTIYRCLGRAGNIVNMWVSAESSHTKIGHNGKLC